ncbi:MAG: heat-inducible transcriptional repressor HrcA [Christensenellaceae bacterium]|jgi:heat-inducible transcriptional repressor|nr:heat-inducible transcriptional repressor HrcA [Christensenellaceae bacterium]
MLSSRKQRVLRAVVDEYIKQATPVSSGEITSKYFDDISSATIRSELSALEEMGYLSQPHTSAGRVPSPLAYKFYVENFIPKMPLRKQDIAIIDASFKNKFSQIEEIVQTAARVISDVTNYTSVIVLKNINKVVIKEIKLVGLDSNSALIIIITDSGIIRDKVITINTVNDSFVRDASLLINKIFSGYSVGELKNNTAQLRVEQELSEFKGLLDDVMSIILAYEEECDHNVVTEGKTKVLNYPEASLESAKNFMSVIDDKKSISDIICNDGDIEFSIKIGKDETGGIDKCAIVTAKYTINGKQLGHAGVIGPERMDYSKVISVLSYVGEALNALMPSDELS